MHKSQGFTLIELVVVIVILGILAATALPKFVDLSTDAHNSAASGVAAAISSGTAINMATCKARGLSGTDCTPLNTGNVCTSASLQPFVSGVSLVATAPTDSHSFQIGSGSTTDCTGTKTTAFCTVTPAGNSVTAATATVTCAN